MTPGKPRIPQTTADTPCPSPSGTKSAVNSPHAVMAASTQTATGDGLRNPNSSKDILAAIKACKETFTTKMELLATEIIEIKQEFDKVRSRISEVEDRVSTVEDVVRSDKKRHTFFKSTGPGIAGEGSGY